MAKAQADEMHAMQREGQVPKLSVRIDRPLPRMRGHRPNQFPKAATVDVECGCGKCALREQARREQYVDDWLRDR